jgi:methyl-accepting chemotaxis protein
MIHALFLRTLPPSLHHQSDTVQQGFFVTGTSLVFGVTSIVIAITSLFVQGLQGLVQVSLLPLILGVITVLFMRITGYVGVAANFLAFASLAVQFYTCYILYGLYSSSVFSLVLLPVIAIMLGGARVGLVASVLTIAGLVWLYSLHISGYHFPGPVMNEVDLARKQLGTAIIYVILGTSVGAMFYVTRRSVLEKVDTENEDLNQRIIKAVKNYEDRNAYLLESIILLLEEMDAVSKGNFHSTLEARNDDEIGMLIKGFNDTIGSIRGIVSELAAGTQSAAFSFYRINTSIADIARSSQKQTDRVQMIYRSIEQMQESLNESIDHAQASSVRAATNAEVATEASKTIELTARSIKEMVAVVRAASDTVVRLGDSSAKIGSIIGVINEIAGQTNLLALNAAIEAARAGEQGRGFSVVADEVRKLAERTTKATKEISNMIHKIQSDVAHATTVINNGNAQVDEGMILSSRVTEVFDSVVQASHQTRTMMEEVVRNAEQQIKQRHIMLQAAKSTLSEAWNTRQTIHGLEEFANDFGILVVYLRSLSEKYTGTNDLTYQVGLTASGTNLGALSLLTASTVYDEYTSLAGIIENALKAQHLRQEISYTLQTDTLGQWILTEGEKNLFEDASFQELVSSHKDMYRAVALFAENMKQSLYDEAQQNAQEFVVHRTNVENTIRTLMNRAGI